MLPRSAVDLLPVGTAALEAHRADDNTQRSLVLAGGTERCGRWGEFVAPERMMGDAMYGKATQNAIAAMSRLAEVYDGGKTKLSAADIAASRDLQKPFVSKLLSVLSTAGFVTGSRGPGGGFTLAMHPKKIRLYDVFRLFEREDDSIECPFGGGVCGAGDPCPLHDKLVHVQDALDDLLQETTFESFRVAYQEEGRRPAPRGKKQTTASGRASFRAARARPRR